MKKLLISISFLIILSNLFALDFDEKMYIKIPNKYGDYSYLSQKEVMQTGYKFQYVKLSINKMKKDFYAFIPEYKFYSSDKFNNFFYYSKFRMYPYKFMVQTVNLSQMKTDEFLFDTQPLLKDLANSPVKLLQRLFLDKNFYDDEKQLIPYPEKNIYIFLIDSSHFKRLLPDGDYIKDFFICVYYNKNNYTDYQIINSLFIDGYPLPVSKYKKYSLYEEKVMKKLAEEEIKISQAEDNLYSDLSKELKKIKKEDIKEEEKKDIQEKKISEKPDIQIQKKKEKAIEKIFKKQVKTKIFKPEKDKNKIDKNIKQKQKTETDKIKEKVNNPKLNTKEKIKNKQKEKKIVKEKSKKLIREPEKSKIKIKKKKIKQQLKEKKKIVPETEEIKNKLIAKQIIIQNNSKNCKYPISEDITFFIKGIHFKRGKTYHISSVSRYTRIELEIPNANGLDTLKFNIPKGYAINGIYADSTLTLIKDIKNTKKIELDIQKLKEFPIIFIDKSEISPIEWVGIEPIIKDIKKTLKKHDKYAIFYFENEKVQGNFSDEISQNCENYVWDNIYPLATSAGIRMEHLYLLADVWNKSHYSKKYIPRVHLFLSRATLKSLIAMDDWEMTKKKFRILKNKFGECKIIIHAKITKKDNIPLYKLGLPFKKIK